MYLFVQSGCEQLLNVALRYSIKSPSKKEGELDELAILGQRDRFGKLGVDRYPCEFATDPTRQNDMLNDYVHVAESMVTQLRNELDALQPIGATSLPPREHPNRMHSLEHEFLLWNQMRRVFKLFKALWGKIDHHILKFYEGAGIPAQGIFVILKGFLILCVY